MEAAISRIEAGNSEGSTPNHVAIIMDGNGRWAVRRGFPRSAGHIAGVRTVKRVVGHARELGIRYLTLFAFSSENWQRPSSEVAMIMKLLAHYLKREARELAENGIRLQIIGDRSRLSPSLCRIATQAERCTAQGSKMVLTLAISYGGQDEIVFGARALAEACRSGVISPMQIDRQSFGRYLPFAELPQVDLLIRTGGEQRISNFLLWQLAYAELLFLPVYWPDFGEYDLSLAIDNFRTRSRRFGKEC